MHGQLEPGHHLEAVTALDQGDDMLSDETFSGETLRVPTVCPGELEEDNVTNLMKCPVVFLQLAPTF